LGVGYYDGSSYEVLYTRCDFAERYPPERIEEIACDMALESVSDEHQEQLLYDFGRLEATIRQFEGGLSIHVPVGRGRGFGVGVEGRSLPLVESLIGYCTAFAAEHDRAEGRTRSSKPERPHDRSLRSRPAVGVRSTGTP
jgi:hypothetical protein